MLTACETYSWGSAVIIQGIMMFLLLKFASLFCKKIRKCDIWFGMCGAECENKYTSLILKAFLRFLFIVGSID